MANLCWFNFSVPMLPLSKYMYVAMKRSVGENKLVVDIYLSGPTDAAGMVKKRCRSGGAARNDGTCVSKLVARFEPSAKCLIFLWLNKKTLRPIFTA